MTWLGKNGCPLGLGVSGSCSTSTFNFFSFDKNPTIEWSSVDDSIQQNTIGTVAEGAKVEVAKLPFLQHSATYIRPTFMMFDVTGHVMFAIFFHRKEANGTDSGEIHILNPWSLKKSQQQIDVYTLLEEKLGKTKGKPESKPKIVVIDVADEVENNIRYITGEERFVVNLQEGEAIGFCTLWVGIFAKQVLATHSYEINGVTSYVPQPMTFLQEQFLSKKTAVGSQLSVPTLAFYTNVYWTLIQQRRQLIEEAKTVFGDDTCYTAAIAVTTLAARPGGRKKTYRKRNHSRQTRRHRPRKSWKRRALYSK